MGTLTLYECNRELAAALDAALDRETGEIESTAELDNAVGQFKNKAAHVAAYVMNLRSEQDAIAAHEEAIKTRKRAVGAKIKRLHDYLASNMKDAAISRIDAIDGTFSARLYIDRDEVVEIDDNTPIDPAFARVKMEWDKTALKHSIKTGGVFPDGIRLVKKDRLELK